MMGVLFLILESLLDSTCAAETEYTLEPVIVSAKGSFESLSEKDYLPRKKIRFDSTRSTTLETLEKKNPYPSFNLGFPSGAIGSNLGGRSADDHQVSTLGVPLNLPQGGGPDLSFFPNFLWSGLTYSSVPVVAGFSPQGVSSSLELDLWTRDSVRDSRKSQNFSRTTFNADRNLQSYSIGTKKDSISLLAGMNQGRQKGPAGSLSYYFIRKPKSHFLLHLLGTDQDGESPGSKLFPTPTARKKSWRFIPAIESHQEWGEGENSLVWESTYYADLHQLKFEEPASFTSTRSQQYGIENALYWGKNLIALSGRWVNFQSNAFGSFDEFPLTFQYSREFLLSDSWKMRGSLGGNHLSSLGFAPTTRWSFQKQVDSDRRWFFQLNSLVKMPTMAARFYVLGTYQGNPKLKEERVNSLVSGYEIQSGKLTSTTTLKAEFRNRIHVIRNQTTENAGNAALVSLVQDLDWKFSPLYAATAGSLLSYSKVMDSGLSYPDLPYFSVFWTSLFTLTDTVLVNYDLRYMGRSTAADGRAHPDYRLMNLSLNWNPEPDLRLTLGCDNLENKQAEVVLDYPLPGRLFYLNFNLVF